MSSECQVYIKVNVLTTFLKSGILFSRLRGRSGPFYHVNDVNVYLNGQWGGGGPRLKECILCMCYLS